MAKSPKLTGQQEIFAREYVRLGVAVRAYRKAYRIRPGAKPESHWQQASKLMADPKVASRIEELKAEAAARAGVTKETMLHEMAQNREIALDLDQISAAQSASRDRAKVAGLLTEKVEHTGKDGAAIEVSEQLTVEDRGANDLARRIAFMLAQGSRKVKSA